MANIRKFIIRLRRVGKKNSPVFQIVVMNKSNRNRGKYLEKLGYYTLNRYEATFFINMERVGYWLNIGALMHSSVKKRLYRLIFLK